MQPYFDPTRKRTLKKNGRRPSKKNKNGRRPPKKMEDDLKKKQKIIFVLKN
jgi:hypothetical protein